MRRRVRARVPTTAAAALALLAAAFALASTVSASSLGAERDQPQSESAAVSESEVLAAQRAWNKLRDGLEHGQVHGARRREVPDLQSPGSMDPSVAGTGEEPRGAAAMVVLHNGASAGGAPRALLTEYTVDAESSFTAVSRALDALANQTRRGAASGASSGAGRGSGERPAIAKNVYVVEGSVDADTIKGYLNSKRASDALAHTEANALRKVMSMLLQPDATGSISHTRIGRSVDRIPPHSLAKRSIPQYRAQNRVTAHNRRPRHQQKKTRRNIGNKVRSLRKSMFSRSWGRLRLVRDAKKRDKADQADDDDDDDDADGDKNVPKGSRRLSNTYDDDDEDDDPTHRFFLDSSKDVSEEEETENRRSGVRGDYGNTRNRDSRNRDKESPPEEIRRYEAQHHREETARKLRYKGEYSEEDEEDQPENRKKEATGKGNIGGGDDVKEEHRDKFSREYDAEGRRSRMKEEGKFGKSAEDDDEDDDEDVI